MKKIDLPKNLSLFLALAIIFFVYRVFFTLQTISAGDLTYFFPEMMKEFVSPPLSWETFRENGLGGRGLFFQGSYLYNLPLGILGSFLSYAFVERIIWFFPILLVGLFASYKLTAEVGIFPHPYRATSLIILLLNSYFLMILSGGQITVSLGYVFLILSFYLWLVALRDTKTSSILKFALSISVLFALDFRFAYLLGILLFLHSLYLFLPDIKYYKTRCKKILLIIISSLIIFILLHSYWLFPFLLSFYNPAQSSGSAYTSSTALKFFSSADFSKSFSLLHPNYPENIFGKTYFMKPEFIILPLLAYLSLLFVKKDTAKPIIFFAFLGLLSSFLAKGVNPPFPTIYSFLFEHFPGFIMFRDPTKFYVLIALSYSLLIPHTLSALVKSLESKIRYKISPSLLACFSILIPLLLVKDAFLGNIRGTLKARAVPLEYINLKNFILEKNQFFRTLWVPSWQRFGYYSNFNPAVSAESYFSSNDPDIISSLLRQKGIEEKLSVMGIKYVIIPYDSEGEKFLRERKYDDKKRQKIEIELDGIEWLKNKKKIGEITIYEAMGSKDHFWLKDRGGTVSYKFLNPAKYNIKVSVDSNSRLIFSETFDPLWQFYGKDFLFKSEKNQYNQNSFHLPQSGTYEGVIEFIPQKYVYFGTIISGSTLFILIITLIIVSCKKEKINTSTVKYHKYGKK